MSLQNKKPGSKRSMGGKMIISFSVMAVVILLIALSGYMGARILNDNIVEIGDVCKINANNQHRTGSRI